MTVDVTFELNSDRTCDTTKCARKSKINVAYQSPRPPDKGSYMYSYMYTT